MDREERKLARFRAGSAAIGAEGRSAVRTALEYAQNTRNWEMWELVEDIGAAIGRALQKRNSNRNTEPKRRRLVGAQMPIQEADRCKACAALLGVSQYRFVVEALARECRMTEARCNLVWDGSRHRSTAATG